MSRLKKSGELLYSSYLQKISPQYVAEVWPPIIAKGKGVKVYDVDGREYIDLDAGWGAVGLGHCNPEIVESSIQALSLLEHTTPPSYTMVSLMEKLVSVLEPYDLNKFFFGTSGSEAVEHALAVALYRKPNAKKILVFDRAYHGSTFGIMPLSFGMHPLCAISRLEPLKVPTPHCYRCPLGLKKDQCSQECLNEFEKIFNSHTNDIAAVIMEPVLGREAIGLPPGYLRSVREHCSRNGIPFILDEIKSGMGRCGSLFAFELENAPPDILCLGKSLSNGFPLSVTLMREEMCPPDFQARYLLLQTTFSGHVVACARANTALTIFQRDHIPEKAHQAGILLREALQEVLIDHPNVGDIRGKGLMCAIEFVHDKISRTPSTTAAFRFLSLCREIGLHIETVFQNVLVLTPALILDQNDINNVAQILKGGFTRE